MMKSIMDFFYYTKAERKACILLLILCCAAFILPDYIKPKPMDGLQILGKAPQAIQAKTSWPQARNRVSTQRLNSGNGQSAVFSGFDPNQVSYEQLLAMGLPSRNAKTWVKYLSKGGHFRKVEDVLRIYGLPESWYQRAKAYMSIASKMEEGTKPLHQTNFSETEPRKVGPKPCTPIDINQADTSSWQSLRGIGRVLASRIVKFREKLGGFYAIEQVRETYGLADSVYQKIQACLQLHDPELAPLLINQASFSQLAGHPYVGYKGAKAIMNWKDQHGPFSKIEELEAIPTLDQQQLLKLKPYLRFQ